MHKDPSDLVKLAKIVSATLLTAVGAVLTFFKGLPYVQGDYVAIPLLILGLWLLIGAWTGRGVMEWLSQFARWVAGSDALTEEHVNSDSGASAPTHSGIR